MDKGFLGGTIFISVFIHGLDFGYHMKGFALFQVLSQKYGAVNLVEKRCFCNYRKIQLGIPLLFCLLSHSNNKVFYMWLNNGNSVVNFRVLQSLQYPTFI